MKPATTLGIEDRFRQQLDSGQLAGLATKELFAALLNNLFRAERDAYLEHAEDKGNGFYDRGVNLGSLPLGVEVPRSRNGAFRPSTLPDPYQRGFGDVAQDLLLQLTSAARSLNAARDALRGLGVAASDSDLDSIARHFVEELDLRNSRPLDVDWLAIFLDAKYVEIREGDRLRPSGIYVAVGLARDGRKRVLACLVLPGRESLENWKTLLHSLIERGVRNVLIVVQDDFSGLLTLTKNLFPNADHQLCIVHMQRNAKSHLGLDRAADFNRRLRTIKTAYDPERAAKDFDDLCRDFEKDSPAFIAEIRKKREHYLVFLAYPESLRRSFSTTNVVEAVNGQLEILRRNNGGYFHSLDTLKAKLGIHVRRLETGRWRRLAAAVAAALPQLNVAFARRFET